MIKAKLERDGYMTLGGLPKMGEIIDLNDLKVVVLCLYNNTIYGMEIDYLSYKITDAKSIMNGYEFSVPFRIEIGSGA